MTTSHSPMSPASTLAASLLLSYEDKNKFQQLVESLYRELEPQGFMEELMVCQMAAHRWRQQRMWILSRALMNAEMRAERAIRSEAADADLAPLAMDNLLRKPGALALFNKMERQYERLYRAAHREYISMRARTNPDRKSPAKVVSIRRKAA